MEDSQDPTPGPEVRVSLPSPEEHPTGDSLLTRTLAEATEARVKSEHLETELLRLRTEADGLRERLDERLQGDISTHETVGSLRERLEALETRAGTIEASLLPASDADDLPEPETVEEPPVAPANDVPPKRERHPVMRMLLGG